MTISPSASAIAALPSTRGGEQADIQDLRVAYRVKDVEMPALRDVALRVHRGEIVAIVGESGSGKSTLATSIVRLLPPNGTIESGSIWVDGMEMTALSEKELRRVRGRRIGFVPQDPMTSLTPTAKIGPQVMETMLVHGTHTRATARARAAQLLTEAGLRDAERVMDSYPHQLSGGMRQRVLIAIAFAGDPDLIIADEPTSALDVTVARAVMDQLSYLVREHHKSLLIITHDLAMALRRADYIVVMRSGRVVDSGTAEHLETRSTQPYVGELLENSPHLRVEQAAHGAFVEPRIPRALFEDTGESALLRATGLRKVFRSGHGRRAREVVAVDDVSLALPAGATYGIVGESGSGKSTTARMVLRLEEATAGTITFRGEDVTLARGERLRQLRREVQVVYQSPFDSMNPRLTVGAIIDEPARAFGLGSKQQRRQKVLTMLDAVRLPADFARRHPAELSGGQRQRVAIARALSIEPALVVLDEAVSALDVLVQAQILRLLRELQEEFRLAYLFISHDLAIVQDFADYVAVMKDGRVVETGLPGDVFGNPREPYTRELLASALHL
ncbi:dipeptide ABC transporter ATP-binding protein [Microbacterium sp. E-13]|uniref:dipeptide ABC transporter ATP-binding protein n=1 Tax=Microbacterium sp. E-13 TaxID=3404048 RepID=UPI003CFAA1CA